MLNTVCKPCSVNCLNCSGPNSNQCLSCINPEDILISGQCIPSVSSCPLGFYNASNSKCLDCGQYCIKCNN